MCRRKVPGDPHADGDGYAPFGNLVFYAGGRSNGCTSWSPEDAALVIPIMKDDPTTVYIYPESGRHRRGGAGGESRPLADKRGPLLERVLPEGDSRAEILVARNPRPDPRAL